MLLYSYFVKTPSEKILIFSYEDYDPFLNLDLEGGQSLLVV